jgi:ABC-2 type transport system ATP-binding protein
MEAAIETRELSVAFRTRQGEVRALESLDLRIEAGQVFGFLGPNGAGKTTSVKMLLNLVAPTSGDGCLLGSPFGDPTVRARIGFLPEHFNFHDWLRATEFLGLHADLYQMPKERARVRIQELLELVGLADHARKKLGAFSKGMLQRIGLAQALLNDPELVILDEPTSGLDPVGRRLVRDIIRELKAKGTTVFLNSHLLSEVEVTCDRVAFIKHGEVISTSPLNIMMEGEVRVEARARNLYPDVLQGLENWASEIRQDGEHLSFTLQREADIARVNRYLVEQGVEVYALRPQQPSLEDMFIQIVGMDVDL